MIGALEKRDDNDGKGLVYRLKCRREVEAEFYRSPTKSGWNACPRIKADTLILAGEETDTRIAAYDQPELSHSESFSVIAKRMQNDQNHMTTVEKSGKSHQRLVQKCRNLQEFVGVKDNHLKQETCLVKECL